MSLPPRRRLARHRRPLLVLSVLVGAAVLPTEAQEALDNWCHYNLHSNLIRSEHGAAVSGTGDLDGDGLEGVVLGAPGMEDPDWSITSNPGGVLLPGAWETYGADDGDRFGTTLAGGLRLNGDTVGDVVVGAPLHDGLAPDGGSVYALDGATGAQLFVVHGTASSDELGTRVARVGDVDGDGLDDFLAGAPQRQFDASGYAWLLSGADGTLIRSHSGPGVDDWFGLGLTGLGDIDLDGVPDYAIGAPREVRSGFVPTGRVRVYSGASGAVLRVLDGQVQREDFGYALGSGADVDRDGFQDLLVGLPSTALDQPGKARVYSGLTGALLLTLEGSFDDDWFGAAVAGVSDFDGDGYGDVIVGAPGVDPLGPFYQPAAEDSYAEVRSGRDGSILARIGGPSSGSAVGISVAGLQDFDGDGVGDVLVGGRLNNDGYSDSSCVEVLGRSKGQEVRIGQGDRSLYGHSVAAAGDIDKDGTPDLLVGAPLGAYVQVLSGADRSILFELRGTQGGQFGRGVARAGDVDGDGFDDVLVGAADDRGYWNAPPGYAEIYSGKTGQLLHHLAGPGDPGFGRSVSGGEDVNGDGYDDVIVGGARVELQSLCCSGAGAFLTPGGVRVYSGLDGSVLYAYDGGSSYDAVGFSVAMLGDLNGDGLAEFLFGAPGRDDPTTFSSGVVELRSGADGSLLQSFKTFEQREGTAVCRLGDFDGDGVEDFAFSVWDPNGIWSYGAVFVHSGADFSQLWSTSGQVPYLGPSVGYALSSAGDLDGDGLDDVLIGTPGTIYSYAASVGAVGASSGGNLPPLSGFAGWDYFGYSVAGLGDLNGDGKPDVAIGAPTDPQNVFGAEPGWNRVHIVLSNYLSTYNHCAQAANSSGGPASIHAAGLGDVALNDLRLSVEGAPAATQGIFLMAEDPAQIPFADGYLCVEGNLKRIPPGVATMASGTATKVVDLASFPGNLIQPGSQWSFQFWFRDVGGPGGTGANLSDAVRVQFLP